jgi:hypothetical protein
MYYSLQFLKMSNQVLDSNPLLHLGGAVLRGTLRKQGRSNAVEYLQTKKTHLVLGIVGLSVLLLVRLVQNVGSLYTKIKSN